MKKLLLISCVALAACAPDANQDMPTYNNNRVHVQRIGVIEDSVAYDNRRGIYVVTDAKTGKEFVGISGVGIVETGQHMQGKTSVEDER